jgi:hypothetical protein
MTTRTKKAKKVAEDGTTPKRIADLLNRDGVTYCGAAAMQAPGGWCRVGPTWHVPNIGWVCNGYGLASWGTKRGLGQIASSNDCSPTWHARAWTIAPAPHLVLPLEPLAFQADYMNEVRDLTRQFE